jgi:hypothetical protein
VSGGPWPSGEFTPAAGLAASGTMPSGVGFAPGGPAPGGGLAPARRPAGRGGLAVVAAVAVAVLLLAGAGVTGLVLLNQKNASDGKGNNPGTGQTDAATNGQNNGGPASAKYAMSVLPENLCSKVALGKLATSYEKEVVAPSSSRIVNSFASNASCTMTRQRGTYDSLSVVLTVLVYADTGQAVTAQKQAHDTAKGADPDTIELPGIGNEAFAARTITQSTTQVLTLTVEARDGNMRLTLYGTATRIQGPGWGDQDRRQFATDLAEVVKSTVAKLGSG